MHCAANIRKHLLISGSRMMVYSAENPAATTEPSEWNLMSSVPVTSSTIQKI